MVDRILFEVRYLPELKRNLISLGALHKSGFLFKAKDGTLKVSNGSLVVMKGIRCSDLYTIYIYRGIKWKENWY